MPDEKFKLPQSSYEELVRIIKTYGHVSLPASLEEVSRLSGMNTTMISRNAGFLTAIGVLESGVRKLPTPPGKELAQALEHGINDQITSWWRKIVCENDFFEKLLTAIKIRNGMDEDTLEAHIAYSAGQPKKKQFMTGARTVVDILHAAGLIIESDGKITTNVETTEVAANHTKKDTRYGQETPAKAIQPHVELAIPGVEVSLNIQVNINCAPADLGEMSGKLKSLLKELSSDHRNDNESAKKETT